MRIMRNRKKAKRAGGAQRKELVNGIGSKANKPKGKGCANQGRETQRIQQNLTRMKEVEKNGMGQGCPNNEMGQGCLKNEVG